MDSLATKRADALIPHWLVGIPTKLSLAGSSWGSESRMRLPNGLNC